jgi:redox-sensitive bicupin YhaK (pirin superfamily)
MIEIRKAGERGYADHGWLQSHHTFSFAGYHDPRHTGFRALRVINDDQVAPDNGFPTHPHREMEIVTYVVEGALEHRDSMGNGSVIRPGEVQRMTAGTGLTHSEFNPSKSDSLRLLQIWILPSRSGLTPGYEQKQFPESERRGRLRLIGSSDGRDGSVEVHQDVDIYAGLLDPGQAASHEIASGRGLWIQIVRGRVSLGSITLTEGDGAAVEDEPALRLEADEEAEILIFDLA